MKSFPLYKHLNAMDPIAIGCGPTCLRMVAKYYGRSISLDYLRNKSQYGKQGVSMLGLADAAESIGLKSVGAKLSFDQLINDAPLPGIIHWDQYHFVVLTPGSTKNKLTIADPAKGLIKLSKDEFLKHWVSIPPPSGDLGGAGKGLVLLLESTPLFKHHLTAVILLKLFYQTGLSPIIKNLCNTEMACLQRQTSLLKTCGF